MKDYYQILGVLSSADSTAIKSAYKELALKYHPDRNSGSLAAEQKFKEINEAYQVLSDPKAKGNFDLRYSYKNYQFSETGTNYKSPARNTSVYNRYGKFDWKNKPSYSKWQYYRIDREYYVHQLYTLGVVLGIALLILGTQAYNSHLNDLETEKIEKENKAMMAKAELFFNEGVYDSTFNIVLTLIKRNPFLHEFHALREDYIDKVQELAITDYRNGDYSNALLGFYTIKEYQDRQQLENWHNIANTFKALGDYANAVASLEYIQIREPDDIELAMEIADLCTEQLSDKIKALEYYTIAKNIFKNRQALIYGRAFELVIDPTTLDANYFNIFYKRAMINISLNNFDEAVTDCNWGIFLNPKAVDLYYHRGNSWFELNRLNRACKDWYKAIELGDRNSIIKVELHCQ